MKDYVAVSVPGGNLVQSLDSGFVDAATLNPPTMFFAQRRGFVRLLDIGSMVEMASGGLTAMNRTIKTRPDEVKRIIRALQLGKRAMLKSRERTLDLITSVLKMDKQTAADTYSIVQTTLMTPAFPRGRASAILSERSKPTVVSLIAISLSKKSPSRASLSKWRRNWVIKCRNEEWGDGVTE